MCQSNFFWGGGGGRQLTRGGILVDEKSWVPLRLVWLSGLSVLPQTERSLVQSLVRALGLDCPSPVGDMWAASDGCFSRTHRCFFPSLSLPSPLSKVSLKNMRKGEVL